jgi:undecaprenyl-phosphate 4-deoxy-4-formamido-L-arabinose transferase
VAVVELAQNSGQHAAVFAGMSTARNHIVVTIDADLQNPPEEIPKLIAAVDAHGWEVVGSIRLNRQDNYFRRMASSMVAKFARKITKAPLKDWGSMLRAYTRPVVNRMLEHPEHATYIPALATIYSRKVGEVETRHEARTAGRSNYNLGKLIDLYIDLMTSFSTTPLKLMFYIGLLLSVLGFLFAMVLLLGRVFLGDEWAEQGIFTLFSVLFFLLGAQFLAFGILGQYISRIYREVRRRPPYVIKDVIRGGRD